MRELIYYIGASIDGFIARPDGSFDAFPLNEEYLTEIGTIFPETFPAHLRSVEHQRLSNKWFDTVLMGRATYEVGLPYGITSPYPTLRQYVFSTTLNNHTFPEVTIVSEEVSKFVAALKEETGKAIWLCGGAKLATHLYEAGLIDQIILKLYPVVLGAGIPLFQSSDTIRQLELSHHTIYPSGHALLYYRVQS